LPLPHVGATIFRMENATSATVDNDSRAGESAPPAAWLRVAGTVGGAFLGAVLLVAAWAKALDPVAFAEQITAEGLDFLIPATLVAFFALALEMFLGGALVLAVRRWWILLPTTALVVFFLLLTGRSYLRDLQGITPEADADCGCFGILVERTPAEAFWQDLALMVPALLLAYAGRGRPRGWPVPRMLVVGGLSVATLVFAWKAPELPLDNLATRMRPGIDPLLLCAGDPEKGTQVCLVDILPELALGEHIVVMAELGDALGERVDWLNEYHWAGRGPSLWVLTHATEEESFAFRFGYGPAFEIRDGPVALLRRLYRTLPRSFLVHDGKVVATYRGLPPLDELAPPEEASGSAQQAPSAVALEKISEIDPS